MRQSRGTKSPGSEQTNYLCSWIAPTPCKGGIADSHPHSFSNHLISVLCLSTGYATFKHLFCPFSHAQHTQELLFQSVSLCNLVQSNTRVKATLLDELHNGNRYGNRTFQQMNNTLKQQMLLDLGRSTAERDFCVCR